MWELHSCLHPNALCHHLQLLYSAFLLTLNYFSFSLLFLFPLVFPLPFPWLWAAFKCVVSRQFFFPFSPFHLLHFILSNTKAVFFPTMALSNFQIVYNILPWLWQSVVKLKKKKKKWRKPHWLLSFSGAARSGHQNRGEIKLQKKQQKKTINK